MDNSSQTPWLGVRGDSVKASGEIRVILSLKVLAFAVVLTLSCCAFGLARGSDSSPESIVVLTGDYEDVLVDDSRSLLYASEATLGSLAVIDVQADQLVTSVNVGPAPHGLAMSGDGSELYVAVTEGHEIVVINLDSMTLTRRIPLSIAPWDVAVGVPGRLYVTDREGFWSYPVIVDSANGAEIATMTQGGLVLWGSTVKASPDGSIIYIAEMNMYPSYILKYSVVRDKVRFLGSSPFDMYGGGVDFAVGPDGYLYFSGGDYTIRVIDSSTWTIVKTVPDEIGCYRILLVQNGGILLWTNGKDVIAVDMSTGEVLMRSSFTQKTIAICADRNGGFVYGITETIWGSDVRIEKIVTGIAPPIVPAVTGTMTVYGSAKKPVSMDFTPEMTGLWWAEVKDDGLASVDVKFYEISSGVLTKLLAQGIQFNGDRHATKYSSSVTVFYGKTYRMTGEAVGKLSASALVNGLFESAPNEMPVADFTQTPYASYVDIPVEFSAVSSFDPDGAIVAYSWDFGDGAFAAGIIVSHAYANPGDYTVALSVTDNSGDQSSATKIITIYPSLYSKNIRLDSFWGQEFSPDIAVDPEGNAIAVWEAVGEGQYGAWAARLVHDVGWSAPVFIGIPGSAYDIQVEIDESGRAVAVWVQYDGTGHRVYSNQFDPMLGWAEPKAISIDFSTNASDSRVAMNDLGHAVAVWQQGIWYSTSDLWASQYTPESGWGVPVLIENLAGFAGGPQVAINALDNEVVIWGQSYEYTSHVWASLCASSSGWSQPVQIEDMTGDSWGRDVAIDDMGNIFAVFERNDGTSYLDVGVSTYTVNGGWDKPVVFNVDSTMSLEPQIESDFRGGAMVVWQAFDGSYQRIYASRYADGGWGAPAAIESLDESAGDPQLVMLHDGTGVVVWDRAWGYETLWAASFSNASGWSSPTLIDDKTTYPYNPSLAVSDSGDVVIVWQTTWEIWARCIPLDCLL